MIKRKLGSPASVVSARKYAKRRTPPKQFGKISCRLRKFRKLYSLSTRDLQHGLMEYFDKRISHACISMAERGGGVRDETGRIIAAFFGVQIEDIWPRGKYSARNFKHVKD